MKGVVKTVISVLLLATLATVLFLASGAIKDRKILGSWKKVIAFQKIKASWKDCDTHSDCRSVPQCGDGPVAINKTYYLEYKRYLKKRMEIDGVSCIGSTPKLGFKPACLSRRCKIASVIQGVQKILVSSDQSDAKIQQQILGTYGLQCNGSVVDLILEAHKSRMFACNVKEDCTIARGGCGSTIAINSDWKEVYEFLMDNAHACKDCFTREQPAVAVDCHQHRCVTQHK